MDHIINILEDFLIYPQVVQMGILRGICSAHYPLGEMLYPIFRTHMARKGSRNDYN